LAIYVDVITLHWNWVTLRHKTRHRPISGGSLQPVRESKPRRAIASLEHNTQRRQRAAADRCAVSSLRPLDCGSINA